MGNNILDDQIFKMYSSSVARRKSSSENIAVLNKITSEISASVTADKKNLVIFDIDSTLLDTSYRTGGIFKEFARHPLHKETYPKLCKAISRWHETVEVYNPIGFVNHHSGITIDENSDTAKYLLSYWKKRFFNPDWLCQDLPYWGAQEFTAKCLELGADIAYLTGREDKTLREDTLRSLATHRFPFEMNSKRTRLMLKSSASIKDIIYKDEGLKELKSGYDNVYYIENEVELVIMAMKNHPDIQTYLYDSVHSGRASLGELKPNLISGWSLEV
ncbi:HAD family hydrolase [bacterium]|nr:HAD family hydrolase [bacterium]